MEFKRKLPDADQIKEEQSLSKSEKKARLKFINEIISILSGEDIRKIVIIGPCSADNEDSVLEYMTRLAKLRDEVADSIFIIPRVYTSKPRTSGCGYKGMLHRPIATSEYDDVCNGIRKSRQLHISVIRNTGMYVADEMLYPEIHYYISDLLAYTAVGARSVENQQHRLVSSGLDMPVGMKNPTGGDNVVMLNAIKAAKTGHTFFYHGYECVSQGNLYAHSILRGFTDLTGKMHSNYHFEDITELYDLYHKMNIELPATIVDCNHANSRKHYDEQGRISKEVFFHCKNYKHINNLVKGCMIESYLKDGAQKIGENVSGQSITDPCLGWEKTERLIKELALII